MAKYAKLVGCGTLFLSKTGRKWLCAEDFQNDEGGCKGRNYVFVWHISPKSSGQIVSVDTPPFQQVQ
jgi:hypothetical protein